MMRNVHFLLIIVVGLLLSGSADAANTYEDLSGRFVIDLPEGWKLDPQQDPDVYVFKGEEGSIIIQYLADTDDRGELFAGAVDVFSTSGVENVAPEGELKDMSVNDNPARWGVYKGGMEVGTVKVTLYALVGSVSLKEGGIYFVSILNEPKMKILKEPLEKAFQSIRNVGQDVTGVSDEKTVSAAAAAIVTSDEPTTFEHELLSLILPPGWKEKELGRNFEKEVAGWFMSDKILGGTLIATCYTGMLMNESKVSKAAKITVESSMPDAKTTNEYEQELGGRRKAQIVVYKGSGVASGQEVEMAAITATFKTSRCWVCLIGISAADGAPQLEEQVVEVARSAK